LHTLLWVIISGAAVGLAFDIYRSLRKWWGWGAFLTFCTDLLFSLAALAILLHFFYKANALSFRLYIVWGSALGLLLYLRFASFWVKRLLFATFDLLRRLKMLLLRLLILPWQALRLAMRPPYMLLQWFSFLVFRCSEATIFWGAKKIASELIGFIKGLIPPGTKG
jgi:spore cortex biosynthesis protein YabQ